MVELEGIFISTKERVKKLIESDIKVYFGEVLGKHSEVCGPIDKDEISFISDNKEAVDIIQEYGLTSGYNPFNYIALGYELNGEDTEDMTIDEIFDELED